ncbi:MAG: AAA family ATPase, partial [Deltaproteobacteria bacterium]|nr:AAA family ATPase [Deltaproteobacteria bacterium]
MTQDQVDVVHEFYSGLKSGLDSLIIGQNEIKKFLILSILAQGHVLLEGMPGLGKTLSVKALASLMGVEFKRVQFTPDLMPSDITGSEIIEEDQNRVKNLVFKKGPVFTNFLLADEINRASPKTQSALLEAMEEKQVTVYGVTYVLPKPFFVVATQNPIELEGTYPLPEAQLDRFLVKLLVKPPTEDDLVKIISEISSREPFLPGPLLDPEKTILVLDTARELILEAIISEKLLRIIARVTTFLNPLSQQSPQAVKKYIRYGPSPRASLSLAKLAKTLAVSSGRMHVTLD